MILNNFIKHRNTIIYELITPAVTCGYKNFSLTFLRKKRGGRKFLAGIDGEWNNINQQLPTNGNMLADK